VLAKDYLEYSIDLSINEVNVHWCGHSRHSVLRSPIYAQIAPSFLAATEQYYLFLVRIVENTLPANIRLSTLRELFKEDIAFINNKIVKPVTLRDCVDIANGIIGKYAL
jgi:hypothetical protein